MQHHRIHTTDEKYLVGKEYDAVKYAVDGVKFNVVSHTCDAKGNKITIVDKG